MSSEQFSLVWNSFPRNLSAGLYTLLNDEQLVDVTLAAEGQILRAHKLILSVCSTYFKELFKINSCKHPIVILKDVNYRDLSAILHFMYQGEVNIKQEDLGSFLKVAETLQIKGLTKDKSEREEDHLIADDLSKLKKSLYDKSQEFDSLFEDESKLETETLDRKEPLKARKESSSEVFLAEDKSTCNDGSDRQTIAIKPDSIIREMLNTESEGVERIPRVTDEPLDYTSEIGRLSKAKSEPVDYTSDIDLDPVCDKGFDRPEISVDHQESRLRTEDASPIKDCLQNSELHNYNPEIQDESLAFGQLEASFGKDFPYNSGNYGRGRRTVKGMTGSSLPLESTLRVVSELGPTLRVERGKLIRMYSCPWCLRHFTRKENLKLHVRYIHGPLESLTCKLCGNKYKNSNSLRVHSYLYHNTKRSKHEKPLIANNSM